MENSFQTSFIPKKPIDSSISNIRPDRKQRNPFLRFSVTFFIISILISGALYFYNIYLTKQKATLSSNLEKIKNSFDENTINELELFNKRVTSSKEILNDHIVLSPMLGLLGDLTIPSIWYTDFSHEKTSGGFVVKISGIAKDLHSIALQANVFDGSKGRYFKNVVFSNINNVNNTVSFDLEFTVDPSLLSYGNSVSASAPINSSSVSINNENQ